ncbi:hypothetical protein [Trinickia symbiotica]|uniref:hypothetical protein n=1 Tax=Trinickia symbiotica TaxID=863227 RepID=UPI001C633B3C|nr:hypothetical protein [Trinickia symbiotica]
MHWINRGAPDKLRRMEPAYPLLLVIAMPQMLAVPGAAGVASRAIALAVSKAKKQLLV